jgi:nucleotide-binding universal stress UspA family protein
MSGRIIVGYTATDAGEDAVALGARLAAASGSELEVVVVLPADDRSVITPPDASYDRYLRDLAGSWLESAASQIPDGVTTRTNVRFADSFAEGLVAAAEEFGASHIVVGAAHADQVLSQARATLSALNEAEAIVGAGDSIEDAVQHLSWEPGELAIVASSRLAQPRRLFLGSTAAKMLHELPVPMIVVPRTRASEGESR